MVAAEAVAVAVAVAGTRVSSDRSCIKFGGVRRCLYSRGGIENAGSLVSVYVRLCLHVLFNVLRLCLNVQYVQWLHNGQERQELSSHF